MGDDETRAAAREWLAEAKKLEKKWPINAPSVLEMTNKSLNRNHYHIQSSIKFKYMTLNRITIDPEVMSGQPCIRGLRIPVPFILRLLASGKTNSQILKDYPELEEEDIRQALSFASWATTEKTISVTA